MIKCLECEYNCRCKARTDEECKDMRMNIAGLKQVIHLYDNTHLKSEIDMAMTVVRSRQADDRSMYRLQFFVDELYRRVGE